MGFFALLKKAGKRALGGGVPGAIAMVLQVVLLMWLRTTINYQYRNGGTISDAFSTLYADGGIARFYQGVGPALIQGPLSRFGDTAANEGVKSLLSEMGWSVAIVTIAASQAAALWRIVISPVDTLKTSLQVNGASGFKMLLNKIETAGPMVLYDGALGAYMATFVGHYPWFFTYNWLDSKLPQASSRIGKLCRNAMIGLIAGIVSDCVSNSIRVVKTVKQTSSLPITYFAAVQSVIDADGVAGLFLRGLSVKIISNGISSIMFTVLWKYLMEKWNQKKDDKKSTEAKTK